MFTIKDVVYPEKIARRLARLSHSPPIVGQNAVGTEANFSCGSVIRFSLFINIESTFVADARFSSNGCGFMLAAADVLSESIQKKQLTELHGLADADLHKHVQDIFGEIPPERHECVTACIDALRAAFADFRARQIEEFRGEKALICTCFSVTEETIESIIRSEPGAVATGLSGRSPKTVDDIARICNAGGGCGSCRMLIQEMLDNRDARL